MLIDSLEKILLKYKGNIIEIGAGIGETTIKFLKLAKKYNVKVIVIDPHELGWDNIPESYGHPYQYETFLKNVQDYKEYLIHYRVSSLENGLDSKLQQHSPFIFSFVDGLQYKDAVLSDLNLMKKVNVPVICVDDYTRLTEISQVPLAVEEFMKENTNYELLSENTPQRSKAFLIKKNHNIYDIQI